jgi:hypothetical protein
MLQIGNFNKLKIVKYTDFGLFLDGEEQGEILLPKRYLAQNESDIHKPGDILEVFIYLDSEDRLIATTETPLAKVGEFASLRVVELSSVGAFLDWGLTKDLFMPFSERAYALRVGQSCLVYVYVDKSGRICASMRLNKFISKESGDFKEGQSVDLIIANPTELGFNAIINGCHWGVLFQNEIFQDLKTGQKIPGFIKLVRPDGKLDLTLHKTGNSGSDDISEKIMDLLKLENGFLEINDKTSAEIIYDHFGVSKKKYKIALGSLYKKRLITIDEDGIRWTKTPTKKI